MGLIVDGVDLLAEWPAPAADYSDPWGTPRILDWRQHGMEFRNLRLRSRPVDLVVGHWTAGEGDARAVFRVLIDRGLSVHLFIAQDGTVYQYCDLSRHASHAGNVNSRSIGVEIANKGAPPPLARFPRETYTETIQGRVGRYLRFYPEQLLAWIQLCNLLACEFAIPEAVPLAADQTLLASYSAQVVSQFRGFCEHLHVSAQKVDAGLQLVRALEDAAFVSAGALCAVPMSRPRATAALAGA